MIDVENKKAINFLNVNFTNISRPILLTKIIDYNKDDFGFIVTANADHIVRIPEQKDFSDAYSKAEYTTCDSRVVMLLASLVKTDLGEVITGSDLTKDVIENIANTDTPLVIFGSEESDVLFLSEKYSLKNVFHYNPPMGFINEKTEIDKCLSFINEIDHGIVLFCVGSPQQEILASYVKEYTKFRGIGLCVGASINFMTGKVARAPLWVQKLALEWAYRLIKEPRRLSKRYLRCLKILKLFHQRKST